MAKRESISAKGFAELVQQAIEDLPPPYAKLMETIAVVVEEEPTQEVLNELELDNKDDLLGMYQGPSLTNESFFRWADRRRHESRSIVDRFFASVKARKTWCKKSVTPWSMSWGIMLGSMTTRCRIKNNGRGERGSKLESPF